MRVLCVALHRHLSEESALGIQAGFAWMPHKHNCAVRPVFIIDTHQGHCARLHCNVYNIAFIFSLL